LAADFARGSVVPRAKQAAWWSIKKAVKSSGGAYFRLKELMTDVGGRLLSQTGSVQAGSGLENTFELRATFSQEKRDDTISNAASAMRVRSAMAPNSSRL